MTGVLGTARRLYRRYHSVGPREILPDSLADIEVVIESLKAVPAADFLRAGIAASADRPVLGAIEINDTCNINCVMCDTAAAKREKGVMDLDLFARTVPSSANTSGPPSSRPTVCNSSVISTPSSNIGT